MSGSTKTMLVLGAGIFQVPLIRQANKMGLKTIVLSNRPKDPGLALASVSHLVSTRDNERVYAIAQRENVDGIITAASEIAVPTVSYVAEKLNLPHIPYATVNTVCHKPSFKKFLFENNISSPAFSNVKSAEEALAFAEKVLFPVFIKPAEASGSKGARMILDKAALHTSFEHTQQASENGEVIIEKFMPGEEIGGEGIFYKGDLLFFQPTQKKVNEFFVPYSHILPHNLDEKKLRNASHLISDTGKKLGLQNASVNFDIIFDGDQPLLIDFGLRLGGNCLPQLMDLHTGYNTMEAAIKIALGEEPIKSTTLESNPVACYIIGSRTTGKMQGLKSFEKELPGYLSQLIEFVPNYSVDQEVKIFDQGGHNLGYFIFKGADTIQLNELIQQVHKIDWPLFN